MTLPRFAPLLLALGLGLVWPASAAADGADEAASTELFNAGRDLMRKGDYAAACPKLADSARLKPTVGALAKLAECEEHERRLVSAFTRWKQALNLSRSMGDERTPDVEREVARLDRLVPKVRLVTAAPLPPDAVIRVDDVTLSAAGLGVPLPVEPGHHTVSAAAPHTKPWTTGVDVGADGATALITLPALEPVPEAPAASSGSPAAAEPRPAAVPATPPPRHSTTWRTVGIATAGTGVAAAIVGGVLGGYAMRQRDDSHCVGTVCPDSPSAATLRSAKTSADWSTALLVGGGVLFAGGVTLWVTSRDERSNVRVGATPLPGGAMIAAGWVTP